MGMWLHLNGHLTADQVKETNRAVMVTSYYRGGGRGWGWGGETKPPGAKGYAVTTLWKEKETNLNNLISKIYLD